MDDFTDFDAPEYVSEEDLAYIRDLFAQFLPDETELQQMNIRDQAIARFNRAHHDELVFQAQTECLGYLYSGGRLM